MNRRFFDAKKLIDPWSVPHFLFGMLMALAALASSFSLTYAFFATLYLALFWELLEKRYRLREASGNAIIDILLPLCAFVITVLLIGPMDPESERRNALFLVVFLLYIVTNFFAWRARFERDREFLG